MYVVIDGYKGKIIRIHVLKFSLQTAPEKIAFFRIAGVSDFSTVRSKNPVILSVIYHRQNPLESPSQHFVKCIS
jgi:hypothetical protein